MATLPQGSDLRKLIGTNATPMARAGQVDYSPLTPRGGGPVGSGIGALGKAGAGLAAELEKNAAEVDDYETKKRLMDFSDAAERALEEHKRQMPEGGAGYAQTWQERYRDMAAAFVGEKDAHVPPAQRGKVGLAIAGLERQLHERAWRDEYAERDRAELSGLEQTINQWKGKANVDPARHDEVQREVGQLIDLNQKLPQAMKDALRRRARDAIEKEAMDGIAQRATTAQGLEEARRQLAPQMADKGGAAGIGQSYVEQIKGFEGFTPTAKWDVRQHSVGYGTRGKPGETIDKAEAERRLNDELGQAASIVDRFKPGLEAGTRAALISLTFNAGDGWTRAGLGDAVQAGDLPRLRQLFREYDKAGGERLPGLSSRRAKEASWIGQTDAGGETAAPGAEAYAGPFMNQTVATRRAAWARAQETFHKSAAEVQGLIKDQMAASERGIVPPKDWMDAVEPKIRALNDPVTNAMYATMLGKAEQTARLKQVPPAALAEHAAQMRAALVENGGTKEQEAYVEHVEKLAAAGQAQVKANAIGWAQGNQIVVPLNDGLPPADIEPGKRGPWEEMQRKATQLVVQGKVDEAMEKYPGMFQRVKLDTITWGQPDTDAQLDRRLQMAKGVARTLGGDVQAFTPGERQVIQQAMAKGGDVMLHMMSKIVAAAEKAGVDASRVLKEVSPKDAPELAMIGQLAANGGDGQTLQTAAKALAWRHGQGERFVSTIDKAQAKPSLGEYAQIMSTAPTARDSVSALTNLIYEYEARAKGKEQFDQTLYTDVLHRVMGQSQDRDGNLYGGIGTQGGGWFDGKWSSKVLVPQGVRQDKFDVLVQSIRADDLIKMGDLPRDARGNPYSMTQIRAMDWVSVGGLSAGLYALKAGTTPGGDPIFALGSDGKPAVLDVRPALADIQKRRPSIFAGYQVGMGIDDTTPGPEYPGFMTPPKAAETQAPRPPKRTTVPQGVFAE